MKKTIIAILVLAMLGTMLPAISFPAEVNAATATNLLSGNLGTFEQGTVPTGWSAPYGGTLSTSTTVKHSGSYSLKLASRTQSWYSPSYNIYDLVKSAGAGSYYVSLWVYVDTLTTSPAQGNFLIRGNAEDDNSFINNEGGNYLARFVPGSNISTAVNTWVLYTGYVTVLESDLTRASGTFNLMIDNLAGATGQNLYIDDVTIYNTAPNLLTSTTGTFESASVPSGWTAFGSGTLSTSATVKHSGSYSLKLAGRTESYYSPAINIYDMIKNSGAGTYNFSMWVYADSLVTNPAPGNMLIRGNSAEDDNSFINYYGSSIYARLTTSGNISTLVNTWTQYTGSITVLASDLIRESGTFNLMIDILEGTATQNLYIDDVSIYKDATVEKWNVQEISFASAYTGTDLISGSQGDFESGTVPTGWSAFGGGTLSASTTVKHNGDYSLKMANRTATYYSPAFNIYDLLKTSGAGTYTVSFWLYTDTLSGSSSNGSLLIRGGSSADQNSFISDHGSGNYYGIMNGSISTFLKTWTLYSSTFTVLDSDLTRASGTFNVMIDSLYATSGQNLYIDDFQVRKEQANLVNTTTGTFETATIPDGWTAPYGGTLSTSTTVAHNGSYSLKLAGRTQSWYSPCYNLYSTMKAAGAGHYVIKFWIYVDAQTTSPSNAQMLIRGADANDDNSFINYYSGNYYGVMNATLSVATNTWTQCTASFNVLASDLTRDSGTFSLCIDTLPGLSGQNLYLDDVQVYKGYTSPLDDATLDVTFTGPDSTTITMPAFWDGASNWKVRFAPTKTGMWNYTTTCSDVSDTGLHGQTGSIGCVAYAGSLALYQHGFVKTVSNTRYFVYDDGTPFFYLGDTHWGMATESFDSSTVAGIDSQFKYIVDNRVSKGFTVYQSEPIGASYDLTNGLSNDDLWGFYELDRRFQYIADQGLVHTNAQLVFSSDLSTYSSSYSTAYLQKLSRYWVARYGAYPVMWTTAQEVDDDFYGVFDISTSPWKTVFNAVHQYDPYVHPQTAHQEYTGETRAADSAYKALTGYSWFGAQWAPAKNSSPDFAVATDYWNYSGSRPVVNYESHYENLWTNEFGARMQGWTAYLNGMYGQGYGAQDIWLYNSTYDEQSDTIQFGITITVAMKQVTWDTSVNFNTPTQLSYMKSFLGSAGWWQLTPRFDSTTWFSNNSSYYSVASNDNDVYVAYFYNTTTNTGTLKNMDSTSYTAQWFNPRTGAYTSIGTITPSGGQWTIPSKPDSNDWVLYVYH